MPGLYTVGVLEKDIGKRVGQTAFGKLCAGNICSNINFKTIGYGTVS